MGIIYLTLRTNRKQKNFNWWCSDFLYQKYQNWNISSPWTYMGTFNIFNWWYLFIYRWYYLIWSRWWLCILNRLTEDRKLQTKLLRRLEEILIKRSLNLKIITGYTSWTDDFDFPFAHIDEICNSLKRKPKVHDLSSLRWLWRKRWYRRKSKK